MQETITVNLGHDEVVDLPFAYLAMAVAKAIVRQYADAADVALRTLGPDFADPLAVFDNYITSDNRAADRKDWVDSCITDLIRETFNF